MTSHEEPKITTSEHPIVLLHGTNAGPWTMAPFHEFFEKQGFVCYSPTYRFHDLPDSQERTTALKGASIADYVEDIVKFLTKLRMEHPNQRAPIVIGHSLGGLIAQILAGKGLVAGAILLNSSIIHGTLPTTNKERALCKLLMSAGPFWDQVSGLDFDLMSKYALNTMPLPQQHEIFRKLSTESGLVLFEIFFWNYDEKEATKVDIVNVNNKCRTPLLFLSATEDPAIPPSTSRNMANRYGENATFVEVPGRCHYMQLEDGWEGLAQQCLDWGRSSFDCDW